MVSPGFSPTWASAVVAGTNLDGRIVLWAIVGVAVGVYLFVRGFLMLRDKRRIQNTPASKIRSAAMGLVELSGTAEGPQTIPAGITGEACFYYRAIAWQLKESGRNREWKKVADESLSVPFFVNDTTGRMLVDAAGADMELAKNFSDEFNSSFFGSRDMLPENVSTFLARNGVLGGATVRLEERCVKPGCPLFVFGTLEPH
jgi:E3 Ubiquitin ligase